MISLDTSPENGYEVNKVKHFNRKIKSALLILVICLVAFIGFSKAGILFSDSSKDVITVSTSKKTFDPSNYVASVANTTVVKEDTTTQETTTSAAISTTITTKAPETTTTTKSQVAVAPVSNWDGDKLSKSKGVVSGPSGRETYYNLNMTSVVNVMRRMGYSEAEYPYWVREDGVKMLGGYVMVAANYEIRPRGTIIESSLGYAIVCDTGGFAKRNPTQIDVAVNWR